MTLQLRLGRIGRSTPSICGPLICAVLIACMLSFILILYKPTPGPGEQQRLGWQAWSFIGPGPTTELPFEDPPPPHPPIEQEENAPARPTKPTADWWETEYVDPPVSFSSGSLPLDQWSPLLPYDTGISEITITRCIVSPTLMDWCYPKSTPEDEALKGRWVRVERDLNRKTGIYWLHMYYRRTRRLDIPLITDITLLGEGQAPPDPEGWRRVNWSIRDGVRGQPPLYLHYKLGPSMEDLAEESDLITELDVVYGDGDPWYGFEKLPTPVSPNVPGRTDSVWVSYRRGVKPAPRPHPLHFSHDGKFKILQVADLHFSVSHGRCIDTPLAPCAGDDMSITLLNRTLEEEKPDLVVFTGDQLDGGRGSWDSKSVLSKFAATVIQRKIPWAAVLGNHDAETDMSRDNEIRHLQSMPYSLVRDSGNIYGAGNYVIKVRSADSSKTHLLTLYFMDSGAYSKGFLDFFGFVPTEYDYIHQDQIDWFLAQSEAIAPMHRPFKPEDAKATRESRPTLSMTKPNAIMFFHIPLQEAYSTPDIDPATNKPLDVGQQLDHNGSAKKNAGMFEKGLMKADDGRPGNMEVKVVANGHCHISDNCRRVMGLWFCFGGGGSYSGYGKVGFDRRFRIYQVSDYGETITTYKRTEDGKIIDEMALVGKGAPSKYGR